ncbi:hypothetical protein V3C99_013733 [Haemonchus contortus]
MSGLGAALVASSTSGAALARRRDFACAVGDFRSSLVLRNGTRLANTVFENRRLQFSLVTSSLLSRGITTYPVDWRPNRALNSKGNALEENVDGKQNGDGISDIRRER